MRAALPLALTIAALAAEPAAAWQELPFRPLPGGHTATCLRATQAEGGLSALGPLGRRSAPTDLLAAGAAGAPAVRARVRFPVVLDCAAVREAGGAGVAAAPVLRPGRPRRLEMRAALRDPGGDFGIPVALGPAPASGGADDAAVNRRGDALVAWVQRRGGGDLGAAGLARIVAARRAPGAGFGRVEALTAWRRTGRFSGGISIAVHLDGEGRATVAWARPARGREPSASDVEATAAAPGAVFGPAQGLATRAFDVARLALAGTAGGAALLAHDGDAGVRLHERPAAASRFTMAREIGDAREPALALRDDGAAVLAWRSTRDDAVQAMTRAGPGAFGEARTVAPGRARDDEFSAGFAFVTFPSSERATAPIDEHNLGLRAAVGDGGRVALAWSAPCRLPDAPRAAIAVAGTLAGGFDAPAVLGAATRSAGGVAALVLPGGEPAAAWVDNAGASLGFGSEAELSFGGGRVHVARADAAAGPAAPPPAAALRAPRVQRLRSDEPVRLTVRCAAACDVRAFMRARRGVAAGDGATVPAGRRVTLRLMPSDAPVAARRVTVLARISAPGSAASRTQRLQVRVVRRAAPAAG